LSVQIFTGKCELTEDAVRNLDLLEVLFDAIRTTFRPLTQNSRHARGLEGHPNVLRAVSDDRVDGFMIYHLGVALVPKLIQDLHFVLENHSILDHVLEYQPHLLSNWIRVLDGFESVHLQRRVRGECAQHEFLAWEPSFFCEMSLGQISLLILARMHQMLRREQLEPDHRAKLVYNILEECKTMLARTITLSTGLVASLADATRGVLLLPPARAPLHKPSLGIAG
jgi:hypothetical protein